MRLAGPRVPTPIGSRSGRSAFPDTRTFSRKGAAMSQSKMVVYVDGEKRELGQAEAMVLLQAHRATVDPPEGRTAADTADVETAAKPAPKKAAKKAPAKKKAASKKKG